jgi:hypothetical protein
MKIIRLLSTILCVGVIITSFGCSTEKANIGQNEKLTVVVSTDSPKYSSIEELSKKANTVIEGTILSSKVEELNDVITTNIQDPKQNPGGATPTSKNVYTVYTVKVSNSYKGSVQPGNTIEIKQLGGESNNKTYILEDGIKFVANKKYVMFLETYKNSPASLLNSIQSCYIHEDSSKEKTLINDSTFLSANEKNELTLSSKHLDKIKLDNK